MPLKRYAPRVHRYAFHHGKPATPNISHRVPFLSGDVDSYLRQYWAVFFTSSTSAVETVMMRHFLNWYCVRFKSVDLDHHVSARGLVHQLQTQYAPGKSLPILFVNKRLVGNLEDVQLFEERRLLKDILQFGFEWKTGEPTCGPLPAQLGDQELFRGKYVGSPITRPVTQLPTLHPQVLRQNGRVD